jgi:hypothetical protein
MITNRLYTSVFIEEGGWTRYKQTRRANPANFINKHGKKLGTLICSARGPSGPQALSAFRPRGSLNRRVNCRCVPQPRWVGARRNTKGGNRGFVLSCARVDALAVGGYKRSRGREREGVPRDHPPIRGP